MDLNEQLDDNFNESELDVDVRNNFLEAAKWSGYLVISGGLLVLLPVIIGIIFTLSNGNGRGDDLIPLILIFLFFSIPLYYLNQFTTKTKKAIEASDDVLFTSGLQNLKSFFKFLGVLTLLSLLYCLFIIGFLGLMASDSF